MDVLKNSEERYLRYDFSAVEINELSTQLANKIQEIGVVESQKKAATSQFKSQIDMLSESVRSLSDKVASTYEIRKVECKVKYHFPEQGKKQITRMDTGEKLPPEKMTSEEWNLFNQEQTDDKKKVTQHDAMMPI